MQEDVKFRMNNEQEDKVSRINPGWTNCFALAALTEPTAQECDATGDDTKNKSRYEHKL